MSDTRTAPPAPARSPAPIPLRQIGLYAATAITVGNIIGSGIFRSPHSVAQEITALPAVLAAWILGGVLSLAGSLVLAELAVAHPRTGGLYVFIREAFGDLWGFVFGWANLWVIKPTVIASIATVFALYFCEAMHLAAGTQFAVAAAAILLLTAINTLGVREGAGTQSLFTTLKVLGILLLCGAAFLLPHRGADLGQPAAVLPAMPPFLLGFVAAMISILFAYDGWTDSTYVAGEIKDPMRVLPFAILGGTVLTVVIYLLTNLAYYAVLSPAEMATIPAVGSETVRRVLGEGGAQALAVLVAISTFGTTNGAILTGPRVTQAMAADGLLWRPAAHLHPKRGTPDLALWIQAGLSIGWLALSRGFEDVSGWFVTTSWLFYGLTTAAIFVHRRRTRAGQDVHPYRTPLYPLTPIVFIVVTVVLIGGDLTASGWRAWAGVGMAATGIPVYLLWKRARYS
ncbi:MAG: amino acid permease [Candidatus Eisenbacteria bacterium]